MNIRRSVSALALAALLATAPVLRAQGGHFELGAHYGRWSLNILGNTAEKLIDDALNDELQNRILESIRDEYPGLSLSDYRQTIRFDSSGDSFGAGLRWYPAGRKGSFSLGLSVERSSFKVLPTATAQMDLQESGGPGTAAFDGTAVATGLIKATSFLLTFRWDILPSKAIHPYVTFGGGISTSRALDDSSVSYTYTGQLTGSAIATDTITGSETKTLRELRDEALADEEGTDMPIPNFLPFIQVNLGLKFRLTRMVHLLVDVGVLDGFIANAGVSIRL